MIRDLLASYVSLAVEKFVARLPPPRVIYDRSGRFPYLSRYYLTGTPRMPDGSEPFAGGEPRKGIIWPESPALYLHHFHRGDDDKALHNHPWRWAVSLVLVGGYSEERRVTEPRTTYRVERRLVRPGALNFISHNTFHRVDLLDPAEGSWTLFLTGPRVSSWGFWDRVTHEFIPWREFISRIRGKEWQES